MNIAIDYDDTYTKDPSLWSMFIKQAQANGHKVYCITKRYEELAQDIKEQLDIQIIFAEKSKLEAAHSNALRIDVWIDDKPQSIYPYALLNKLNNKKNAHIFRRHR